MVSRRAPLNRGFLGQGGWRWSFLGETAKELPRSHREHFFGQQAHSKLYDDDGCGTTDVVLRLLALNVSKMSITLRRIKQPHCAILASFTMCHESFLSNHLQLEVFQKCWDSTSAVPRMSLPACLRRGNSGKGSSNTSGGHQFMEGHLHSSLRYNRMTDGSTVISQPQISGLAGVMQTTF